MINPTEEKAIKLIPDINIDLVNYVKTKIAQKLKKHTLPAGKYKGADIYKFGDTENGYVVLVDEGEVIYFVKYKRVKFNGTRYARQVLVWRNTNTAASIGFADFVFFKRLLPTFKCLISDQLQTEQGKRFWLFAIDKAVQEHLYVYLFDRSTRPMVLTLLPTIDSIKTHTKTLWGKLEKDALRLLITSISPIKLRDSK
jgi:hypothetical protein